MGWPAISGNSSARTIRDDNIATRFYSLNQNALTAASFGWATGDTNISHAMMFDLEQYFDSVQLIFGNISTASTVTLNGVTIAAGQNAVDTTNNTGFVSPIHVTFGGANSAVIPLAAAANKPALIVSDWVQINSLPRTDVIGGRPLLYVRTEISATSGTQPIPTWQTASSSWGAGTGPNSWGRYNLCSWTHGSASYLSGNWAASPLSPMSANNFLTLIGVRYKSRYGRILTVAAFGDSITRGTGNTTGRAEPGGYLHQSVFNFMNANATASSQISNTPCEWMNCGFDGQFESTYYGYFSQFQALGIYPNVAIYAQMSPNSGPSANYPNQNPYLTQFLSDCAANRIYPLCWTSIPCLAYSSATDALRLTFNADLITRDVQVMDFNAQVTDNGTPQRILAALTADGIHPNAAGNLLIANNVVQPKIAQLAQVYFSGSGT